MIEYTITGFSDEIDPSLDIQLDVLDTLGIKHIEMRGVNGKGLVDYSLDEVKEIKKTLDARGFKISAIGSPLGKIGIVDDFEPHMELMRHTAEIARIMNTKYIRMFSFFIPKNMDALIFRDEVFARINAMKGVAKEYNIVLCHENEKDIYGDTVDRCLDLMENLHSENFRFVFDPSNFVQSEQVTWPDAYDKLNKYIEYIHIKDAVKKTGEVVPSGMGDGHVEEILTALFKKGYKGYLSLEPHLSNFVGFADLEEGQVDDTLPEGGAQTYGVAYNALKAILNRISN